MLTNGNKYSYRVLNSGENIRHIFPLSSGVNRTHYLESGRATLIKRLNFLKL